MPGRLAFVLAATFAYALLRYRVFGSVELEHAPTFLLNKSISFSSVVFLVWAGLAFARGQRDVAKLFGKTTLHLAGIHILLSLTILSADYFPMLFGSTGMNLSGELLVLSGALAAYLYAVIQMRTPENGAFKKLIVAASALVALHVLALGWQSWIAPADWHGALPPISLLTFLGATGAGMFYLRGGR